tara:strand:- start:8 stop:253 length:246 start_codon:yes stop_codon:yes gene_type:complete
VKITKKQLRKIILKEMANDPRICLTPGSFYDFNISPREIGVNVRLPMAISISEAEAIELEELIHDAMESILARYFGKTVGE